MSITPMWTTPREVGLGARDVLQQTWQSTPTDKTPFS